MTPNRYALASFWLGAVLFLGTAYFAATNTAPFIVPLLKKLAPGASNGQLHATHMVLRKLTHLAEYALLALLWFGAIARTGRPVRAAWLALLVCLACAVADEAHQAMTPARTGSVRDVLIDVSGAAGALLIARGWRTSRTRDQMRGGVAAEPVD
jgi:VanZ family protein